MEETKFMRLNNGKPMYSLIDFEIWAVIRHNRFNKTVSELLDLLLFAVNKLRHYDGFELSNITDMLELSFALSVKYGYGNDKFEHVTEFYLKPYEPLACVLTKGAQKYAINNWKKKSDDILHCADSMLRHILALQEDRLIDDESGCHHVGHIMANAMFLAYHNSKLNEEK